MISLLVMATLPCLAVLVAIIDSHMRAISREYDYCPIICAIAMYVIALLTIIYVSLGGGFMYV